MLKGRRARVCSTPIAPSGRRSASRSSSRANKSIGEFGPIFGALGLLDSTDPEVMKANMAARKDDTPEARERRRKLRESIAFKAYEFDAHGVEMNQFYAPSDRDRQQRRTALRSDPELVYQPSSCPGSRLPHVWFEKDSRPLSTLDIVGGGASPCSPASVAEDGVPRLPALPPLASRSAA